MRKIIVQKSNPKNYVCNDETIGNKVPKKVVDLKALAPILVPNDVRTFEETSSPYDAVVANAGTITKIFISFVDITGCKQIDDDSVYLNEIAPCFSTCSCSCSFCKI